MTRRASLASMTRTLVSFAGIDNPFWTPVRSKLVPLRGPSVGSPLAFCLRAAVELCARRKGGNAADDGVMQQLDVERLPDAADHEVGIEVSRLVPGGKQDHHRLHCRLYCRQLLEHFPAGQHWHHQVEQHQ